MRKQCFTTVHGWSRYPWRPVVDRFLPLGQRLLAHLGVLSLVWNVVRVVSQLVECTSFRRTVINFLSFISKTFFQPSLEVLFFFQRLDSLTIRRSATLSVNFSFLDIILGFSFASSCETSGALR
jgi:hypothetical protein